MASRTIVMMTPPVLLEASEKISRTIRRRSVSRRLAGQTRLHLACGSNVLEAWANIDYESNGAVIGWDLTEGLPVGSETIERIFCEHFIEHITLEQAQALVAECYRCLRPAGVLRLSTPNLNKVVEEYQLGRTSEWHDVGWSPVTPCRMVNEAFRLWGHQFVYDENELTLLLRQAGFPTVRQAAWRESGIADLRNLECRPFHGEVILEAVK